MTEPREALLIKLGGSLITDKANPETARAEVIARLAQEIARAARQARESGVALVVGHGSGSFGHVAAARSQIAHGVSSTDQLAGIAETQERAAALHRLVIAALLAAGALPYSIAPSSCLVAENGQPVSFPLDPLRLALGLGLLPVVYGDVVMDRGQGVAIASTETLLLLLARRLPEAGIAVRRALWLGETEGVWDAHGRTIPRLTRADVEGMEASLGQSAGTDVTGGMRHRVEAALTLADLGVTSWILDGRVAGALERAVAGDAVPGTVVLP